MSAVYAYRFAEAGRSGIILCSREHLNSLEESSLEEVKAAIRSMPFLDNYFDIGEKYIRTKNRRVSYAFAGLRQNLDALKSKHGILLNWTDEAEGVCEAAWRKLIPTIRGANDLENPTDLLPKLTYFLIRRHHLIPQQPPLRHSPTLRLRPAHLNALNLILISLSLILLLQVTCQWVRG